MLFLIVHSHKHGHDYALLEAPENFISTRGIIQRLGFNVDYDNDEEYLDIVPAPPIAHLVNGKIRRGKI